MNAERLSEENLRELYREGYVSKYPSTDNGRLSQQLPFVRLDPSDRVVDFACGNGLLLDLVHAKVRDYVGVDFSSEFIEDAQSRMQANGIENGSFHCGDIVEFSKNHPEEFDVAFASDFSEHIYDDDVLRIYGAMKTALKPGGKFYTHTPNGGFLIERLKAAGILKQLEEHIAVRGEGEMRRLLAESGWRILRVHRLPHYRWYLAWLQAFAWVPGLKDLFSARLLFECEPEVGG